METGVVEVLVKKDKNKLFSLLQGVSIFFAVASFALMIFMPLAIIGVALFVGLRYLFFMLSDIEYEYAYFDRELTIDRIYAKSRRKKAGTYLLEKVEIAAPADSFKLDNYKNKDAKVTDYSDGKDNTRKFVMYYEGNQKLILEYDAEMVKAMRMHGPSKIFEN